MEKWKEIGEILRKRREELGLDLKYVAYRLGVSMSRIVYIEQGRFGEVDDPIYVKTYIKRYADLLGLDGEELSRKYWEGVTGRKEEKPKLSPQTREIPFDPTFVIFAVIIIVELFMAIYLYGYVDELRRQPALVLINESGKPIEVNGEKLESGGKIVIEDEVEVRGNEGVVVVKSFSGKVRKVRMRDFKVVVNGGLGEAP